MLINYYDRNAANFYYIILGKDLLQTNLQQLLQKCTHVNALDRYMSRLIFK